MVLKIFIKLSEKTPNEENTAKNKPPKNHSLEDASRFLWLFIRIKKITKLQNKETEEKTIDNQKYPPYKKENNIPYEAKKFIMIAL